MTNLSEKFDDLQAQLATQHTALMSALNATNGKLDALITAMGGAPPTATTTLADVIAAIQAGTAIAADIHLDTKSIDQKLITIRNEIIDTHTETIAIDQKLLRIRDAISPMGEDLPQEARTSVVWSLYRLLDAIQPVWPRPTSIPLQPALNMLVPIMQLLGTNVDDIQRAMGLPTGDALTTVLGRLSSIEGLNRTVAESTGMLSGPANGTILQLLACICDAEQQQLPVNPLDPTNPLSCEHPYISTGSRLAPISVINFSGNVIYATWSEPLPPGTSYGTVAGLALDEGTLSCDDWSAYRVFVETTEAQYSEDPLSTDRYPTNVWRQMQGSGLRTFSVRDSGNIRVYLCFTEEVECITSTNYIELGGYRRFIFDLPNVEVDANGYHLVNLSGWQFDTNGPSGEASGFFVQTYEGPNYTNGATYYDAPSGYGVITGQTVAVAFLGDSGTTSVTLCPPGAQTPE